MNRRQHGLHSTEIGKGSFLCISTALCFFFHRMYISSLYAFTRFLAPEDVPYVFTFDNTGKMPHFSNLENIFMLIITGMLSILTIRGTCRCVPRSRCCV